MNTNRKAITGTLWKASLPFFLIAALAWTMPNRCRAAAAAGGITAAAEADPVELALERLGTSHGLQLEEPTPGKTSNSKPQTPTGKEAKKEDSEFEETAEERAEREREEAEAKKQKDKKGSTEGNENEEGKTEATLEVEAFTQQVSDLEKKLAEASDDEKATVQAELDKANEGLELWQAELDKEATAERPEFAAEQETYVKAVEGQAAEATKKIADLEGQVTDLQQQLDQAGEAPVGVQNIHPLLYADKLEEVQEVDASWRAFEKWALENWDGVEGSADGKQRAFTKEQVRARYSEIKEARENLIPLARQTLQHRQQAEARARKEYPELFKASTPDRKVLQSLLKQYPGLKVIFPDVWTVVRDALEGQRAREARAKAKGKNLPSARGTNGTNGARKHLPRAARPGGSAAGGLAAAAGKGKGKKGGELIDMTKFMDGGGDKAALVAALS